MSRSWRVPMTQKIDARLIILFFLFANRHQSIHRYIDLLPSALKNQTIFVKKKSALDFALEMFRFEKENYCRSAREINNISMRYNIAWPKFVRVDRPTHDAQHDSINSWRTIKDEFDGNKFVAMNFDLDDDLRVFIAIDWISKLKMSNGGEKKVKHK